MAMRHAKSVFRNHFFILKNIFLKIKNKNASIISFFFSKVNTSFYFFAYFCDEIEY